MNEELKISDRGILMPESPIRKLAPLAYGKFRGFGPLATAKS